MNRAIRLSPLLALLLAVPVGLAAQDTRTVVEPFFPPLCTTVDAQLQSSGGSLAAADEQKLDTARIQRAIDRCGKGRAVELHVDENKNAFLTGPLQLRPDVGLILDMGVTLYASRDPRLYDVSPGSCGVVDKAPPGCKPLISVDRAPNSAVMGDGTIDGRGGETLLLPQRPGPVAGNPVPGQNVTWWDLAEQAHSPAAAGKGGHQQAPRLIVAKNSDNFILYRIRLKDSPNFNVVYDGGDGFTVWGVRIDAPERGARDTDAILPGNGARNITITHSFIRTGDNSVSLKGGPGGVTDVTVSDNHFYWGHGMSIGSETRGGVSHIRVTGLSLDGPENGIRIESNGAHGGLVEDVIYDNVCIRNSPNPIIFDATTGALTGNSPPTFDDIVLHNVRISGGGKITFSGYDRTHRLGVLLNGVQITDDASYTYAVKDADLQLGPEPTNLQLPAGTDSTVAGKPAEGTQASCAPMFVPFPQ